MKSLSVAALALVLASGTAAGQGAPWIHIEVIEDGESEVKINVPLALAEVAASVVPDKIVDEITNELSEEGIEIADVRRLWTAFREVGDAEFLTVDSEDENVTFRRQGDVLLIDVDQQDGEESVNIEVPIDVVDALLGGEGNELNLIGAIERLKDRRGHIVQVLDGDETVRIWIDERG